MAKPMMSQAPSSPLAIDLFCGLGGWTEGLQAEGYRVVGFDVKRHQYPARATPESSGRKVATECVDFNSTSTDSRHRSFNYANECALKDSPLTGGWVEYPAQLVIQDVLTIHGRQFKDAALIVASPPCQEYSYMAMPWSRAKQIEADYRSGKRDVKDLTALFDACFRIQREASEAAGHYIPLVVENVRGAQKWVGRSRYHFGSFHLWGDVPALMPIAKRHVKVPTMGAGWYPPEHTKHVRGLAFNGHTEKLMSRRTDVGNGARFTSRDCGLEADGLKQGGDCFNKESGNSISRRCSSRSKARKAASAMIAKIPLVLSRHVAKSWKPERVHAE